MISPRLRLADLLAAAPSRESSSYGRCRVHGCLETTRENKDFCLDHLSMIPYVADLERRISARQEQDDDVRRLGHEAVDVNSATATELLRHLDQYGPRTEERCVRELTLDDITLQGYIEALRVKGFVDTGRTKRGSVVVMIAGGGREHLRLASGLSTPAATAQNVSVDDAKLPAMTGVEPPAEKIKRATMSSGNGTGKSRRSKLQEAHAACEKAYAELAKAHADGDREEVALVWSDVTAAEASIAAIKAAILSGIVSTPCEKKPGKTTETKTSVKTPEKKVAETAKTKPAAKPAAKKSVSTAAFSNWLRLVRTGLGMTQSALGEKIGASYTQMFRWEKGLSVPAEEYLAKIERIAGKTCPYRQKTAV